MSALTPATGVPVKAYELTDDGQTVPLPPLSPAANYQSTLTTAPMSQEISYGWVALLTLVPRRVETLCDKVKEVIATYRNILGSADFISRSHSSIHNNSLYEQKRQALSFMFMGSVSAKDEEKCLDSIRSFCKLHSIALCEYRFRFVTHKEAAADFLKIDVLIPDTVIPSINFSAYVRLENLHDF